MNICSFLVTDPVSCHDIYTRAIRFNINLPDGVYNISYHGNPLPVYCDMTQDGGGWTLLVLQNPGYNQGS